MADNVVTSAAIGTGITLATDDISSVHYQRVKLSLGADGTANDASAGAGAVGTGTIRVTLASDDPAVTALQVLDNAISGSEMQVDIVGALPAGTNAIGKLASNTGVTIGAVEIAAAQTLTTVTTVGAVTAITNALPAGTNAIGKLAANSGVDIGDVDILSIAAGDNNIGNVDVVTLPATPTGTNLIGRIKPEGDEYETVAASATAQVLGATGGTGDYIAGILVVPATTSPGNVLLLDNATSITVFAGGASSVTSLVPFLIPLGITSVSGAWKVTTGTNVSCIGIGNFT